MQEQIEIFRSYVRMAWIYRWMALVIAGILCAGGWAYILAMPDQYDSSAKIFIDTRSMLRPLLRGIAVDSSMLSDTAALMRRTLLTRPNLEEVARRTDLDLGTKNQREFDDLVDSLSSRIKVAGASSRDRSNDNIYDIMFNDKDPAVAKRVVDELLNIFLETALGDTRKDSTVTQKFLDEQIAEYEQRLVVAEERLKEFKQRNVGVMPGSQGGYFERYKSSQAQLEEAKLLLSEAINRRNELAKQIESGSDAALEFSDPFATSPAIAGIDARIQSMQSRLDELLVNYTDRHPDVINIRTTMQDLQRRREEEVARAAEQRATMTGPVVGENAYQAQMHLALGESDAQVASLKTRVAEYERRVAELAKLVDTVPEVEAELSRLNRDYEIQKNQYDQLVSRREQARLGQQAGQTADDVQIRVIEPARQPLTPTGPNRVLFVSIAFGASLGIGAALAFLLSQINPRVFTGVELKSLVGVPILGQVSLLAGQQYRQQRMMELAAFSVGLLGLTTAYAVLIALHMANVNVHSYVIRILG